MCVAAPWVSAGVAAAGQEGQIALNHLENCRGSTCGDRVVPSGRWSAPGRRVPDSVGTPNQQLPQQSKPMPARARICGKKRFLSPRCTALFLWQDKERGGYRACTALGAISRALLRAHSLHRPQCKSFPAARPQIQRQMLPQIPAPDFRCKSPAVCRTPTPFGRWDTHIKLREAPYGKRTLPP